MAKRTRKATPRKQGSEGMQHILDWIGEGLEKPGKTKAGLAEALGIKPPQATKLARGDRRVLAEELAKIAKYLEMPIPFDAFGIPDKLTVKTVKYVGTVRAGSFTEPHISEDEPGAEMIPYVPDARYEGLSQFAVKVAGRSIDKVIPDGGFAICVRYSDARPKIQSNDLVLVERRFHGRIETTIKRLKNGGAHWQLMPESTDPRFQKPVRLNDGLNRDMDESEMEIEISGLVIGAYTKL